MPNFKPVWGGMKLEVFIVLHNVNFVKVLQRGSGPQSFECLASPGNTAWTTAPIRESAPGDLCVQIRDNSLSLGAWESQAASMPRLRATRLGLGVRIKQPSLPKCEAAGES